MKLEMYICKEELEKLLGAYFSEEVKQKVVVITKCDYEEVLFEYRKYEKIRNAPVLVSVTLDLNEIKEILSKISDKYEILNISANFNEDVIIGFSFDVKEKAAKLTHKDKQ